MPGGDCVGTRTVRAFHPQTNHWTTLAPFPMKGSPVAGILPAAAVAHDGRIYVLCCGDATVPPRSSFAVYVPTSNRWTMLTGSPHRRVLGYAAATAGDGRIDFIGGCPDDLRLCGRSTPVDAYDPRTNTWTPLGVTQNARQALAATTGPGGRVYAVGGAGSGNGTLLEVIRQRIH